MQGGKNITHARYYRTLLVTEQLPTKVQGLFVSTKCKFVVQRGDSELKTRHHSNRDSKDTFKQVSSVSNCTEVDTLLFVCEVSVLILTRSGTHLHGLCDSHMSSDQPSFNLPFIHSEHLC